MTLKYFANKYEEISMINFLIIVFVNVLFVYTLEIDELDEVKFVENW